MKKIYKNPETIVVSIVAQNNLMVVSAPGYDYETDATEGNLAPSLSFDEEGIF